MKSCKSKILQETQLYGYYGYHGYSAVYPTRRYLCSGNVLCSTPHSLTLH